MRFSSRWESRRGAKPARRSSASSTKPRRSWTTSRAREALDAGLASSAQAVEHYEIARYGTLKTWAKELGLDDAAKLLDETLKEEIETDQLLTKIAKSTVNLKAA